MLRDQCAPYCEVRDLFTCGCYCGYHELPAQFFFDQIKTFKLSNLIEKERDEEGERKQTLLGVIQSQSQAKVFRHINPYNLAARDWSRDLNALLPLL